MTTIVRTPKNTIAVAKPTDPWNKVREAADKLVEARKRAARVGAQTGFRFHETSRSPGGADGRQSFDELHAADAAFQQACRVWFKDMAPLPHANYPVERALQAAIDHRSSSKGPGNYLPGAAPGSDAAKRSHVLPPGQSRMSAAKPAADALSKEHVWTPGATEWLVGLTRPLPADHWMAHRFFLQRPGNAHWVGATNGHAMTLMAVDDPKDVPYYPKRPKQLNANLAVDFERIISTMMNQGPWLVTSTRLHMWAPSMLRQTDDPERDVDSGTVYGLPVNRRLLRAATNIAGPIFRVLASEKERMIRVEAPGFVAVIMARHLAPGDERGPELIDGPPR